MMRRKKKPDPNAPPPPPRDNGLPPRPEGLDSAKDALMKQFPGLHVVVGFGFPQATLVSLKPKAIVKAELACWRLYAFTDDASLQLPADSGGFPVERRSVPRPVFGPPGSRGRGPR